MALPKILTRLPVPACRAGATANRRPSTTHVYRVVPSQALRLAPCSAQLTSARLCGRLHSRRHLGALWHTPPAKAQPSQRWVSLGAAQTAGTHPTHSCTQPSQPLHVGAGPATCFINTPTPSPCLALQQTHHTQDSAAGMPRWACPQQCTMSCTAQHAELTPQWAVTAQPALSPPLRQGATRHARIPAAAQHAAAAPLDGATSMQQHNACASSRGRPASMATVLTVYCLCGAASHLHATHPPRCISTACSASCTTGGGPH
jgi:hypothetical protein